MQAPTLTQTATLDLLTQTMNSIAPRTKELTVAPDLDLMYDLGLDSLEIITIVSRMIDATGVELDIAIVARIDTVASLLECFVPA